eukprot:805741-Prymnesium_polylepis.1
MRREMRLRRRRTGRRRPRRRRCSGAACAHSHTIGQSADQSDLGLLWRGARPHRAASSGPSWQRRARVQAGSTAAGSTLHAGGISRRCGRGPSRGAAHQSFNQATMNQSAIKPISH